MGITASRSPLEKLVTENETEQYVEDQEIDIF